MAVSCVSSPQLGAHGWGCIGAQLIWAGSKQTQLGVVWAVACRDNYVQQQLMDIKPACIDAREKSKRRHCLTVDLWASIALDNLLLCVVFLSTNRHA